MVWPKGSKRVSLLGRLTEHWVASKTYDEQKFEFYKNAQVANMKGWQNCVYSLIWYPHQVLGYNVIISWWKTVTQQKNSMFNHHKTKNKMFDRNWLLLWAIKMHVVNMLKNFDFKPNQVYMSTSIFVSSPSLA